MLEREKLTVTISRDLFAQIDSIIDGKTIRNRSHATEFLIRQGLGEKRIRTALVLAGGVGTRLRPLTLEIPKPMIPVHGRPLLEYTIAHLASHDIRTIILSIGYKGDQIQAHFGNGERFGVRIRYIKEDAPLGTAGPLKLAARYLKESFLLINGDVLTDLNITELVHYHRTNGLVATLALAAVTDPEHFGAVRLEGGRVIDFVEKPKKGEQPTNLINAGYTVCEPSIFSYVSKTPAMLEDDTYPALAHAGQLAAYPFSGQWFHVGTAAQYEKALRDWRSAD